MPLPAAFTTFLCDDAVWEWRAAEMTTKREYVDSLDGMVRIADEASLALAAVKDRRLRSSAEKVVARKRKTYSMLRAVVPPDADPGPARRVRGSRSAPRK